MKTSHLYYQDSKRCQFTGTIIDQQETDRGLAILLDQTAFYPTSGGQPYDRGTLGGIPVLEVWEDEEGRIWHLLEGQPDQKEVTGLVDWPRRFDHMQQHTGQHILSAAFLDELNASTIGFHMGAESSTIDLDIPGLTDEDLRKVEEAANRVVWENRPVNIKFIRDDEIETVPFRKPPQVSGEIRVIWVEGYDASACGGTHVSNTGEIGMIKIAGTERYKGGVRITFLCGQRALKDYQRVLKIVQETSAGLSIHQNELKDAITRMQEEIKTTGRELNIARKSLMQYEAEELWKNTPETGDMRKIFDYREERAFDEVRSLAESLRQYPKTLALLAALDGENIRIICSRSDDLPQVDAAAILRQVVQSLGGRGGGSQTVAQGGAPKAPREMVIQALQSALP